MKVASKGVSSGQVHSGRCPFLLWSRSQIQLESCATSQHGTIPSMHILHCQSVYYSKVELCLSNLPTTFCHHECSGQQNEASRLFLVPFLSPGSKCVVSSVTDSSHQVGLCYMDVANHFKIFSRLEMEFIMPQV